MTMGALPVLVAGGGIGGLSTALALARRGIRVRVLEQAAAFGEIGAGIQLAPNASRVLDALGVLEDISADAVFPDYAVMIDARDGREITRIALGAAFVARYGYRYMVVHRQDLLAALLSACRREAAIALLTGKSVGVLRDFPDRVEVSCADGSVEAGAALIGADGVWSGVRAQVIGDGAPRVSGHVCYRGTLPMAEIPDHSYANAMALWVGEAMHLVQYPVRRGELMNNVAVIDSPKFRSGMAAFGDWGEVETLFATAMPRVRDMLGYMDRERNWILHDRDPLPHWTRGRVTLLGDAAHPTLQNMAQGACMAIEDAVCLAQRMAAAGSDVNGALLAYQQDRYLRTARVQISARFVAHMVHLGGGARDVRNAVLGTRSPESTYELDWLYKGT